MLEIPESHVIAAQITQALAGKKIYKAIANQSPHRFAWYAGNPENYGNLLEGKVIQGAVPRGGIVEIQIEDMVLTLSDGATARYYTDLKKVPKKNQLYLEFTDQTALVVTVQMYGGIMAFPAGTSDNTYYLGSCEKISPLSDAFTYDYFSSLITEKEEQKSAKAFLATEQRIPGLGNGVLQDILFKAGIHPKRKMKTVTMDERLLLYQCIRKVLSEMFEQGGRDTEKDLFSEPGKYMTYLSKNTYDKPCPVCGYLIHKESYMGGTIYYCEHCQK